MAQPASPVEQPSAPSPALAPAPVRGPWLTQATDTERAPKRDAPGARLRWYGWQTIAADIGAFGLMLLGGELSDPGVMLFGVGAYVALSPAVHMFHSNDWALDSFLLRGAATALLIGGALVIFSSCPLFAGHCGEAGSAAGSAMIVSGLLLGVAMPFVDAALALDKPDPSGVALIPWLTRRADGGGLALTGSL
jgi:hypothetical protein